MHLVPRTCAAESKIAAEDIQRFQYRQTVDRPGRRTVEAGGAASRKEAAKTAAPGRRQAGDKGTQKTKKASVAPKEK